MDISPPLKKTRLPHPVSILSNVEITKEFTYETETNNTLNFLDINVKPD